MAEGAERDMRGFSPCHTRKIATGLGADPSLRHNQAFSP